MHLLYKLRTHVLIVLIMYLLNLLSISPRIGTGKTSNYW